MAKPETLKMIEAAERRMRGVTNDERPRTGGVIVHGVDDGDAFEDDGEDGPLNSRRPASIQDIDSAAVYAKFNKRAES